MNLPKETAGEKWRRITFFGGLLIVFIISLSAIWAFSKITGKDILKEPEY